MAYQGYIDERHLDYWVRISPEAERIVPELIARLVGVSDLNPIEKRFPCDVGQPGPDGNLNSETGFDPYFPKGKSLWEIGTGGAASKKATSDYNDLTRDTPEDERRESTFIFVTPLSGRKDWPHTWKGKANWLSVRRRKNEWKDVRVIDGTILIEWLHQFPAVEKWLANKMGIPVQDIETVEERWEELRTIGDPPPLIPQVFLANRDSACQKLKELLSGVITQLRLETRYPRQAADFVAAYVAAMEAGTRIDTLGRCLIISSIEAWNAVSTLSREHVLIANFDIDSDDSTGVRLIQKACRTGGHLVIYEVRPGGPQYPNQVSIPNPKIHQLQEALEEATYKPERARMVAYKSDGNLGSLLKNLQNLSLLPEWSQGTDASELTIAEFLGLWNDRSKADNSVAEKLSGKPYGEWIAKIREIAFRPGTPLMHREGAWKVVSRYEGWYALGSRVYDEFLDTFRSIAVDVLKERDPQFELPVNERYRASVTGKVLSHSRLLRKGIAETLALLGSHPEALKSCSLGKAEITARLAVREILNGADWLLWASLNRELPLLAEAAPNEFLEAVEAALDSEISPFEGVFAQEGDGITGGNYTTGLLWALETLAWDSNYLTRVLIILGDLAQKDPGGKWANRPANSLTTILLPWYPQTCAPVPKRQAAVDNLLMEVPDVAWKLLLTLMPSMHQVSSGSYKPCWREIIPDDWSGKVTNGEYWEQINAYTELAISAAKQDSKKLIEIVSRLDDILPVAQKKLLDFLCSDTIALLPQEQRLPIWTALVALVARHRKFEKAEWAMKPEVVNEIAEVADRIAPDAPFFRYQRMFSERDYDLLEDEGADYSQQIRKLEILRQNLIEEIFSNGGIQVVLNFAKTVESSWRVGIAFGAVAPNGVETEIYPDLLESESKALSQFAGGFTWGRFRKIGWQWVDSSEISRWKPSEIAQFLCYLPFSIGTWERAAKLLGVNEPLYWAKTNANPYEAEQGIEIAIDKLLDYSRPHEAARCLESLLLVDKSIDTLQAVRVLKALLIQSPESARKIDSYSITKIIKALQEDVKTNSEDLFQIEWAYLPLLEHSDAEPITLEQRLIDNPGFFCEVIRVAFKSKKEVAEDITEERQKVASNAYRLLRTWNKPPGTQKDGSFNEDALNSWLISVKKACEESGHLEIAMTMVGHVLIHTPPDPDGLWIHHAAAAALNAKDANDMRDGFRTELFNSRGVHSWTAGKEERQLAQKYRSWAEAAETRGYVRLASTLHNLAESYVRDAERESVRDPYDEWSH